MDSELGPILVHRADIRTVILALRQAQANGPTRQDLYAEGYYKGFEDALEAVAVGLGVPMPPTKRIGQ